MLTLKTYQDRALASLSGLFTQTRTDTLHAAWDAAMAAQNRRGGYSSAAFGDIPCVCLRIPTGGGKTLLAAHAIAQTGKVLQDTDAPIALWLTPSDAIRTQTLDALKSPTHPYRLALEQYFPQRVRVCDLESLVTVGPHDVGKAAVIIVATIQSFRIGDTSQRNVYAFDETLEPHFQGLNPGRAAGLETVSEADLENQRYFTRADVGRVKASIANWLHLHRPIVIVDEAHNSRTHKSFETLKRLNPACIIELTATPLPGSNVLYHVAAQELKAEDMIKLPIILREHPTGWEDAVRDAILTRKRLETLAQGEADYLRPLALFQAQPKGGAVTVDVLHQHLMEQEHIPKQQIAIATGSQKELDGVNLFDPACPVRFVITVEALKEGWDCSFAYVLCSLQESRSAKDVEQLLGRVLRMPYARSRGHQELNRAYAHIVATSFAEAAEQLTDRMINNMGFDPYEAAQAVQPPPNPDMFGSDETPNPLPPKPVLPDFVATVPGTPTLPVPAELAGKVEIRPTSQGATVIVKGEVTEAVETFLLSTVEKKHQGAIQEKIDRHRAQCAAVLAPASRGEVFAPIPMLCLWQDGEWQPVEKETLAELGGLNLLQHPVQLAGFAVHETARTFEIDLDGKRISYTTGDARQLSLNDIPTEATEQDLVRWLDRETRQPDISQAELLKYLGLMVRHLIRERGVSLTALVRAQFQLAEAIRREIDRLRQLAISTGFQKALPGMEAARLEESFQYRFEFRPNHYMARPPYYGGRFKFKKHYYPQIHDLRERRADGSPAEEFLCALAIEAHPLVKQWVRNVEREPRFSFWLPTATDYFYPDFVCELTDGRLLAVEYKGEPYKTNDDSREKMQVGHQWEKSSNGRCLFLMAVAEDEQGRNVAGQIAHKIGQG
jgi:type III restriction enzyme